MNYNRKFAGIGVKQRAEHSSHGAISRRQNSAAHTKSYDLHETKTHSKMMAHITPIAISLASIFFAFTQPEACKAALLAGYETCVTQLLFALFPFLIAANLLIRCGAASTLARPLKPLCRALGFAEPCAAGLLGIALLGGFAPAVSGLSACVASGQLNKPQASRLLPLLCFLGPSYIIIAVGAGMLGNLRTGVYLFAAQVCASVCTTALLRVAAAVLRRRASYYNIAQAQGDNRAAQRHIVHINTTTPAASSNRTNTLPHTTPFFTADQNHNTTQTASSSRALGINRTSPNTHEQHASQTAPSHHAFTANQTTSLPQNQPTNRAPTLPDFTTASVIADSFFAFLRLCGVILFFQFLAAGVGAVLSTEYKWLCESVLEVTAACGSIAALGNLATYRCCAALSLLSASILMQISALCPRGVSCKALVFSRLLHLPLALLCFRLLLCVPQTHAVYSSLNSRVIAMPRLPLDQSALLFIALLFLADRLRKPLQRR